MSVPNVITTVAILANESKNGAKEALNEFARFLEKRNIRVILIEERIANAEGNEKTRAAIASCEIIVAIGGDGTLLEAARLCFGLDILILPVHYGTLGFISELSITDSLSILERILNGTREGYAVETRRLLDVVLTNAKGETTATTAINEAALVKGAYPHIAHFEIDVNGKNIASVKSDGVIVASPTGSTAYALAAGGPIVHPNVEALTLVAIAPHSLTFRPLVIPFDDALRIRIMDNGSETHLSADGQGPFLLQKGDAVAVRASNRLFKLLKRSDRTFYDILKGKLNWGN